MNTPLEVIELSKVYNDKEAVKNISFKINRNEIKKCNIISSPGCYPTSILLPLIPLFDKNLVKVKNVIIDSKSGYSGAGRGVHKKYKSKNLYESLSAYGVGFHRHNAEIDQVLKKLPLVNQSKLMHYLITTDIIWPYGVRYHH